MQAILGLISEQANSAPSSNANALDISANHHPRLLELISEELNETSGRTDVTPEHIHDFELSLVDTQAPCLGGANEEFVFSARLDNLFSTFAGVEGLIESLSHNTESETIAVWAAWDNEEIGSVSAYGAESNFLEAIVQRLAGNPSKFDESIAKSYLLSADMGHAVHPAPDHAGKHQSEHKPLMNKGPAIKTHAKVKLLPLRCIRHRD